MMKRGGGGLKAMDLLKNALAERQAKAQKTISETGQKWVRRSEIEARQKEEYLEQARMEEEKRKAEEEAQLERFASHVAERKSKNEVLNKANVDDALLADALLDDDNAEPPMALSEVVDRLREMGQPITLFGETDMQRYKRLRFSEKEAHEGKQNPDVLMLEEVHSGQRLALPDQGEDQEEDQQGEDDDDKSGDEQDAEPAAAADDKSDSEDEDDGPEAADDKSDSEDEGNDAEPKAADDKSDSEDEGGAAKPENAAADDGVAAKDKVEKPAEDEDVEVDTHMMDRCDFIRQWTRKALKAWEKELADKPDDEKKSAKCKSEVAAHRQVRRDVRPLQKRLRMYVMEEWLLDKIHTIVKLADDREYRDAAEAYIDLSIGKAAWPVGIGCGGSMLMEDAIGLHDRFNRMKQVKDIAYALNDEVTRKFVQALKRLMNVAQRYWPPTDPSKASG